MSSGKFKEPTTRTTISCEECRRRKRKCSKDKPVCNLCQETGSECVYRRARKRGPPTGYMRGKRSASYLSQQTSQEKLSLASTSRGSGGYLKQLSSPFYSLSKPSFEPPKIPLPLQTELFRTFLDHFSCSAPLFHHEYLYHRLTTQALPDFLLQVILAIGSRFFLNAGHPQKSENLPADWVSLVKETDFAGNALHLAQQQLFVEPNVSNAMALTLLALMLLYDGQGSAATMCLVLGGKIVKESGLALQDISQDVLDSSPINDIEKEERRRLFWWLLPLDHWARKKAMSVGEKTACILLPRDEPGWQKMPHLLPSALHRPAYESRAMWSFMIEIELLLMDISILMNSVPNRNKQPELFEISQSPNGMFEDVPLRLAQFQDALHSWNNRLPLEYRYDAFRNVCRDPAQAAENPHTSAHIHILKLIHLGYLKSWLHVHHIRVTLHWNTEDMGIVKGCLETAEALTSIVRSLPDNELVDEPVTLSNCILACSVLVTFIEYILHSMTRKLNPAEYSTRLGSVEKWQLAMQAKRHINTIHDRFSSIVTVWRYSTLDLSRLAEIRAIAQHRCTQIHAQIMALPLSSLQGKSIPNPLELRNVAIPSDLDTIYHECDSIKEVPNSGLVLPDNQGA